MGYLREWVGLVKLSVGPDGIGQELLWEKVGSVKCVCGSGWDWAGVTMGVGRIVQDYLWERTALDKSVCKSVWDCSRVCAGRGGIGQKCLQKHWGWSRVSVTVGGNDQTFCWWAWKKKKTPSFTQMTKIDLFYPIHLYNIDQGHCIYWNILMVVHIQQMLQI